MQLVAQGAQDAYLSGNPQITFWKGLYKRHTNFAMEPFRVNLTGQANWGVKHSAILPRHADLVFNTYIEIALADGEYNNDGYRAGYNLIKYVELDIGGQVIDRLYGEWLFLWDCLSSNNETGRKLFDMVGFGQNDIPYTLSTQQSCENGRESQRRILYIPLTFFYTRNPSAALPLIALQYHEVKINILWNDAKLISGSINGAAPKAPVQVALYADYIYLDVEERRRMAQESHEYLIEQTQFNEDKGITSANNRIDLTFNHPVKELVWVVQPSAYTDCNEALNSANEYSGAGRLQPFTYDINGVYQQHLQINGQDRLERRFGDYFNKVQPYQHHTGSFNPSYRSSGGTNQRERVNNGAYCYSFALRPEEHQPSGTCNFSRIDTATLVLSMNGYDEITGQAVTINTDTPWNVRVYAVNYNVLRVMSGMAGLAYSN